MKLDKKKRNYTGHHYKSIRWTYNGSHQNLYSYEHWTYYSTMHIIYRETSEMLPHR